MHNRIAPLLVTTFLAACSADQPTSLAPVDASATRVTATVAYDVTITNLTTGQPLSPSVLVTHGRRVSLFRVGASATAGIQAIAEDGNPGVAAAMLTGAPGVSEALATAAPIHRIGGPGSNVQQVRITADAEHRLFSFATMLICSNDGFAGVNAVALPTDAQPITVYANAYDAGTERNSEAGSDIVPPCFGIGPVSLPTGGPGRRAENGVIRMHPGVQGGSDRGPGDLVPGLHGWQGPVAMVTIQRVGPTS